MWGEGIVPGLYDKLTVSPGALYLDYSGRVLSTILGYRTTYHLSFAEQRLHHLPELARSYRLGHPAGNARLIGFLWA